SACIKLRERSGHPSTPFDSIHSGQNSELQPLATDTMPLDAPPPRGSRFGSSLVLSRVHWVRPELVAEVRFLAWTEDNLLRQVVYEGLREDKPAKEVRRGMAPTRSGGGRDRAIGTIIT